MADVDGDEVLDLLLTDTTDDRLVVMRGDGQGEFSLSHALDVPGGPVVTPSDVVVGDFGGSGNADIAVSDVLGHAVVVFRQDADGEFEVRPPIPVGQEPHRMAAADLDGDGDDDIVASNRMSDTVTVLSQGASGFEGAAYPVDAYPTALAIVDIDGDGALDIAAATGGYVSVLRGAESGGFEPWESTRSYGGWVYEIFPEDLDSDGDVDFILLTDSPDFTAMLQAGDGSFSSVAAGDLSPGVDAVVPMHLDTDGHVDLLIADRSDGLRTMLGDVLRIEPYWGVRFWSAWGGWRSQDEMATIRNTGSDAITIDTVAFGGPPNGFGLHPVNCIGTTLAPREACNFWVSFLAPRDVNDDVGASIRVAAGAIERHLGVGASVQQAGYLRADVVSVDFGEVARGEIDSTHGVEVTNGGSTSVRGVAARISSHENAWTVRGCPSPVLDPGESCTAYITFAPPMVSGRNRSLIGGSLRLNGVADGSGGPVYTSVSLSGTVPVVARRPVLRQPVVPTAQHPTSASVAAALRRSVRPIARIVRGGPRRKLRLGRFGVGTQGVLQLRIRARVGGRWVRIAKGGGTVGSTGSERVRFSLNRAGRRVLAGPKPVRIEARLRFRAVSMNHVFKASVTRIVRPKRKPR
ncbi:MAG: VCBS repeat-containing protein [Rhodococcus sp.]|nr:VCBS repeat-containing protein [Rhodococcus sp. (in: high G+C Gram-positive bacteria)]